LRQRNIKRDDIPFNDPVLQAKTLSQINTAFDSIESEVHTPLDNYYFKLMEGYDEYCTTPGVRARNTNWMPLSKIRWMPICCDHLLSGSTMLIFSPVDVFSIMWMRIELERTIRCFYGIQSLLAKENTNYFLAYTANPRARKPSWRLRSLGDHEIAKGLPIVLSATSSFPSSARRLFENLNPLPPLQPIPPEQSSFHDFVVQVITSGNHTGTVQYEGNQFVDASLSGDAPPQIQRDTREGGTHANLNTTLLERARETVRGPHHTPPGETTVLPEAVLQDAEEAIREGLDVQRRPRRRQNHPRRPVEEINRTLARMANMEGGDDERG